MAVDTASGVRDYKNYVGGEWIEASSGETFDVINPATEEVIATVPNMSREDAQGAIGTAREAFDSGVWSGLAPDERSVLLACDAFRALGRAPLWFGAAVDMETDGHVRGPGYDVAQRQCGPASPRPPEHRR